MIACTKQRAGSLKRGQTAWLLCLLIPALVLWALLPQAHAASYTVTDLGDTYSIQGSQGKVINDNGEVIGNQIGLSGTGAAAVPTGTAGIYTSGSWVALGAINTSGSGYTATTALGLNNAGLVVGEGNTGIVNSTTSIPQTDAFFVTGTGGAVTALRLVSATNANQYAAAHGCNNLGVIVGNVGDYSLGTLDTFLYLSGSGVISLKSDNVYSIAINKFGDVLGSLAGLAPQAAINGDALPSTTAGYVPHAINNSGQILLSVDGVHPLGDGWGMIYDYGTGEITSLGNLSPKSAGFTTFLDINDAGQVVGRGSDQNLNPHAVLYSSTSGLISLDNLGLTSGTDAVHLIEAEGINNSSQIICTGYTTDAGDLHGYLLTPVTQPVQPLAAVYDGVASAGGAPAGMIAIAIAKNNVASVKLTAPGISYSFKATLSNAGFSGPVGIGGTSLNVTMQADAPHLTITGTITGAGPYTFSAIRQATLGIFAGKYTALLPTPGGNPLPQGIGYGLMTVSKTGAISIAGESGDGAPYTAAAKVHYDGSWTFYAPLYKKPAHPGALAGSLIFNRAATDSDCAGSLEWINPGGSSTAVTCKAALFKATPKTQILHFTSSTSGTGTFAFAGGNQSLPSQTLSVTNNNVVTVTDPGSDALTVKLSSADGALTGSFIPATGAKKTSFSGVVQQKLNIGGGVFVNQSSAGSVTLTPQ